MTEDTGYCAFCNQPIELTKGRTDTDPGKFIQTWIKKLEITDCFGLTQIFEGTGSMFICKNCRERLHSSIENNAKLASQ